MKPPTIRTDKFILRSFKKGDEKSLKKNINNRKISRNTLAVPYPYTFKNAVDWVSRNLKEIKKKNPGMLNFVIEIEGEVAGSVGFHDINDFKAELGYWLAEKYWGRGIMTEAVKMVTKFAFGKLGLTRIYARVPSFNRGSMRVLEKAGYKFEGVLRKNVCVKRGGSKRFVDDHIFAKVMS